MKYEVTIKEVEIYLLEVSAQSEEEALEKARALMDRDRDNYHHDSDELPPEISRL